jgi:hypothetical protein
VENNVLHVIELRFLRLQPFSYHMTGYLNAQMPTPLTHGLGRGTGVIEYYDDTNFLL